MEDQIIWEKEVIANFLNVCTNLLTTSVKQEIDRRTRSSLGYSPPKDPCHECGKSFLFARNSEDVVGKHLDKITRTDKMVEILVEIAERGSKVYKKMMAHADTNRQGITNEEDYEIKLTILKEAIILEFRIRTLRMIREQHQNFSKLVGQLAIPTLEGDSQLNLLDSENVAGVMNHGYAIIDSFLGGKNFQLIYKEMELLEFEGLFNDMSSATSIRTDKICWLNLSDLDRFKQPGLHTLFQKMSQIPFELNQKAKLGLQMGSTFQLSFFPSNGSYYKWHVDNCANSKQDNGRKLTCIYYPNDLNRKAAQGGGLRIYPRIKIADQSMDKLTNSTQDAHLVEIVPKGDRLVLFSSREIPHEVIPNHNKIFEITFWITGPINAISGF